LFKSVNNHCKYFSIRAAESKGSAVLLDAANLVEIPQGAIAAPF
jgi:hypothetical protein